MDKAPIERIAAEIKIRYVFPEKAENLIDLLRKEVFSASDEHELATLITDKLV